MTRVVELDAIERALVGVELLPSIAEGYIALSNGQVVVPPVGEMSFDEPPGEAHLKYGFIRGDAHFVVKIATGFYRNPALGLSSSNGALLVFSQRTGVLQCILLDQGCLTDLRTALGGAVAAKCLAPRRVQRIGVLGAGIQARLQLQRLREVTGCRLAMAWARRREALDEYAESMGPVGFKVERAEHPAEVAACCNLIVTTTPACEPLLWARDVRPGTHITAVGSDTPDKNELDPEILGNADKVVVDSLPQSRCRGEAYQARRVGILSEQDAVELGAVLQNPAIGRTDDDQITVADLTGVAVQDIQIAKAVLARLGSG